MRTVFDPTANTTVLFAEAKQPDEGGGSYLPLRSPITGEWFALYVPTFTALKMEDVPAPHRSGLLERTRRYELSDVLLRACEWTEAKKRDGEELTEEESRKGIRDALHKYGKFAFAYARGVALGEGYDPQHINLAFGLIEKDIDDSSLLEGVEIVRASELLETTDE